MTRKELQQVKESYRELAKECLLSKERYASIAGVCKAIALDAGYNHHERGQHIWAFFTEIEELRKESMEL